MTNLLKKENIVLILIIIGVALLLINIIFEIQILKNKERIVTSVNMTNNLVEITKKVKPAVVQIIAETNQSPESYFSGEIIKTSDGKTVSSGTGFFIDSEGYIATANHVIANSNNILVIVYNNGNPYEKKAKIIKQSPSTDTAVIKIDGTNYPFLETRDYDDSNEGEDIGLIGFPLGMNFPSVNKGVVSSKITANLFGTPTKTYTVNAFINPGNSGGPLFSLEDGKVIGIINSKIRVVPNNLYIPPVNIPTGGEVSIMGIDFKSVVDTLVDTRNILLELADKNSQQGIGFSVSTDYIKSYK